jgi:hypothetical protein
LIDYLKILSKNTEFAELLFNDPLLKMIDKNDKFSNKLNEENKKIKSTYIKTYKEILFCFFIKDDVFTKLEILIKPHYYFNDNLHNANNFNAIDCINTLTEIKNTFNFPINELSILNIEFGLNCNSPIDIKELIHYAIYHEKNEFINSSDTLRFSKISFKHTKYGKANQYKMIKFYAKGLQFPKFANIDDFRFEVKSKERKYIKSLGIYTYADLLKFETYNKLADTIRIEFNKVLIIDSSNEGRNLTPKEKLKLNEYLNTIKWFKSLQSSRNLFSKYKKEYFKLLDKTENNIHKKLYSIIDEKLIELIKPCAISDVYIIGNCTQKVFNKCPITGLPLTHEKVGAKYIKTSTLNYLHKNDKNKFVEVCSLLLNNSKGNRPRFENDIISHLYKQVRNRFYNPVIIKQTGYKQRNYQNQLDLF